MKGSCWSSVVYFSLSRNGCLESCLRQFYFSSFLKICPPTAKAVLNSNDVIFSFSYTEALSRWSIVKIFRAYMMSNDALKMPWLWTPYYITYWVGANNTGSTVVRLGVEYKKCNKIHYWNNKSHYKFPLGK